jgi:hypothetical protein
MNLREKLKKQRYDEVWQEYCGFLDLDLDSYMQIQSRLMLEQIHLWCQSLLGKTIAGTKPIHTIEEFRAAFLLLSITTTPMCFCTKRGNAP